MRLGLFGYGRLGRLLSAQLSRDFSLLVSDPFVTGLTEQGQPLAAASVAAAADIVLLAVPISSMESVCYQIAPFMRPGQLLLDTCSVKLHPLAVMRRTLPEGVEIIGTHPLFGPDSAREGLAGHKIVLCPGSQKSVPAVQNYLESLGLQVLFATPEAHDKAMAETQCLFHLMARAIQEMGIVVGDLSTPGPEKLFRDFAILQHDTPQLFRDLQTLNPYAPALRGQLVAILERLDRELQNP